VAAVEVSECDVGGEGLLLHIKAQESVVAGYAGGSALIAEIARQIPVLVLGYAHTHGMVGGAGAGADRSSFGELELRLGRCTTGSSGEELVDPRTRQLMPIISDGHASSSVSSPDSVEADSPSALF
jgi:hypothetical protein